MKVDSTAADHALPWRRKVLFYALACLLPLLIVFAAVEAYLRVTYLNIDLWEKTGRKVGTNPMAEWGLVDAFCAYRARPGKYGEGGLGKKTANQFGFISTPELAPTKPQNTVRIAFLGGSAAAGTGHVLADQDTWPWIAAELLAQRYPRQKIEFINGALGGYSSFESFGRLWARIRFFSPDVVVLCHGWNEMYYFNKVDRITRWRTLRDGSWSFDRTTRLITTHKPLLIDYLLRPSQVLTRLRLRFGKNPGGELGPRPGGETSPRAAARAPALPPPRAPAAPYDKRALEIWRTNLRLFRETAAILNAELFVARQATLIVSDLPAADRERCRYDLHGFGHEGHVSAFAEIYRVIDEEIPADHIIDTAQISGVSEYFYDHVHPTKKGAREIARIVADALTVHLRGPAAFRRN